MWSTQLQPILPQGSTFRPEPLVGGWEMNTSQACGLSFCAGRLLEMTAWVPLKLSLWRIVQHLLRPNSQMFSEFWVDNRVRCHGKGDIQWCPNMEGWLGFQITMERNSKDTASIRRGPFNMADNWIYSEQLEVFDGERQPRGSSPDGG